MSPRAGRCKSKSIPQNPCLVTSSLIVLPSVPRSHLHSSGFHSGLHSWAAFHDSADNVCFHCPNASSFTMYIGTVSIWFLPLLLDCELHEDKVLIDHCLMKPQFHSWILMGYFLHWTHEFFQRERSNAAQSISGLWQAPLQWCEGSWSQNTQEHNTVE